MDLLQNEISIRRLPDLFTHRDGTKVTPETWEKRRAELRDILSSEEYGYAPEPPAACTVTPTQKTDHNMCAGKVTGEYFNITFPTPKGSFTFPACLFLPNHPIGGKKPPVIIHLNFRPLVPDKYFPLEEITDAGFAAAQIYYEDVTSDNADMTNGLAAHYPQLTADPSEADPARDTHAWGKLRMWAFAASRLLDVLLQRDDIDRDKITVVGHSRLGKTALLAAAMDDRFAGAMSNDSGCSGAAVTRSKTGETVSVISRVFPYWFCPRYQSYTDREYEMPFDQHFLAALIAPRLLCIGSAWEDTWADPQREFMTAVLAAQVPAFLKTGKVPDGASADNGLPLDRYPVTGESFVMGEGTVHYHVRPGTHYFSREDWNQYLAFLKVHFFR